MPVAWKRKDRFGSSRKVSVSVIDGAEKKRKEGRERKRKPKVHQRKLGGYGGTKVSTRLHTAQERLPPSNPLLPSKPASRGPKDASVSSFPLSDVKEGKGRK